MLRQFCTPIILASLLLAGCGRGPNNAGSTPGAAPTPGANPANGAGGDRAGTGPNYTRYVAIAGDATRHARDVEGAYVTMRQVQDYDAVRERFNSARTALDKLMDDLDALPRPSPEEIKSLADNKVVEPLAEAIYKARQAERRTMRDFIRLGFWRDPLDSAERIARRLGYNRAFGPAGAVTPPNPSDPPAANTAFADLSVFGPGGGLLPRLDPESPAAIPWRVAVDPPADPVSIPADLNLEIDVPGYPQRANQFSAAREGQHMRLVYPLTPSTVVAAGLNEQTNETREVWTLSPRRRIGRIRALQLGSSHIMAISPDGLYFAAQPQGNDLVGLYDVDKEKPVGTVPLQEGQQVTFLAFAAENRLIAGLGDTVAVWSVPELEVEREIPLKSTLQRSPFVSGYSWSLSPGGRYLVAPHRRSLAGDLYVYDLTTGEIVGGMEVIDHGDFLASAFSDDGRQLAVLASTPWQTRLQTWDVAAGTIADEWVFDKRLDRTLDPARDYQGPAIDWFPDGRRLFLFGRGIFDTEQGAMTGTLPDKTYYRIKPLAGDAVAVIQQKQLVVYDTSSAPQSTVSAGVEGGGFGAAGRSPSNGRGFGSGRVVGGGPENTAVEATRPDLGELTPVDRVGVELVDLAPPANWSVAARSAKQPARSIRPVELPRDELFAAAISQDASRAVVMYSSERPSTNENTLSKIRIHFDPIDLATGEQHPAIELPLASGLLDVAPDGSRMVTRSLSQPDRIDIWELPQGTPVASLQPYPQASYHGGQAVAWAAFVDADHLLTMGGARISLWDLPEAKAVYEFAANDTTVPVLDASRELMARAAADGGGVWFVNTRDGTAAGFVPRDPSEGQITSLAFNAEGTSVVLGTRYSHTGELAVVDLSSGQVTRTFPVPDRPEHVQWCGNDRLLLNGAYLIDVATGALVWVYESGAWSRHLVDSPDGRHWYLAQKSPTDNATLVLTAAELPELAALGAMAGATPPSLVLQSGGRIALDLQLPSPPGRGNLAEEVRTAFTGKYEDFGITVDNGAPLKLSVRGQSEKTGDVLTTSLFRFGPRRPGDVEIDEQQVTWTVSLALNGQTLWQTRMSNTNAVSVTIDSDYNASAQQSSVEQQTIQKMWENAANRLVNFDPPRQLFAPESVTGLGRSSLSAEGVVAVNNQ